jgi:hypothetical protein
MADSSIDPKTLVDTLLSSDLKADLLTLFRRNPGIIDTPDGIAARVGVTINDAFLHDLNDLAQVGILSTKKIGAFDVISLNRRRDAEVQEILGSYFGSLQPVPEQNASVSVS